MRVWRQAFAAKVFHLCSGGGQEKFSTESCRYTGKVKFYCLLFVIPLAAQVTTGSLVGTVRDASGGVIAAARVLVEDPAHGFRRSAVSSSDGLYRFVALPPPVYGLR